MVSAPTNGRGHTQSSFGSALARDNENRLSASPELVLLIPEDWLY